MQHLTEPSTEGDTPGVTSPPPLSSEYFDAWYAAMERSSLKDAVMQRYLGLPEHLVVNSTVPWPGLDDLERHLRLPVGGRLLDLACGRGRIGQELATRTDARLVGVDFSPEALRQAAAHARAVGCDATYAVGDLLATGQPDSAFDTVLVVDSIQFASSTVDALREVRRVLREGGRVVLTGWEARSRGGEQVPARLRDLDLDESLRGAGFVDVVVETRDDWRAVELAMWAEAAALDPGDDPALVSFHEEGLRAVAAPDALRRVLASATAPSA